MSRDATKKVSSCFMALLLICQTTPYSLKAEEKDPRVTDRFITPTGELVRPDNPTLAPTGANGTNQITLSKSPFSIIPGKKELSVKEVTDTLDALFEWGPAANRYASNFLMLPGTLDIKNDKKATLLGTPPDQTVTYRPYNVKNPDVSIKLARPGALVSLPPFTSDPGNAIFVRLDGFGSLVPIPVAEVVEASFINGLVTRLLLGEYARMWKKDKNDLNLSFAMESQFSAIIQDAFIQPANYTAPNPVEFSAAVAQILSNNPVHPVSLLYGWKAGDELDALNGDNKKYRDAVWKLLGSRFDMQDMGRMVAFTLTYLAGYSKNQRIVSIVNGGVVEPTKDPSKILDNLANDPNINNAKKLISGFTQNVVAELYSVTKNTTLDANKKEILIGLYFGLIKGLTSGASDAADQVYLDVFRLAYGIGYRTGFRDGYAEGFAAGYKDGYATGYKNAWAEANKTISALQSQISQLQSDSGGGFWDTVSKIGSSIGTAVGTIGSIIALF